MKRILWWMVPILLVIALLGGIGVRVCFALQENAALEQGFTPKAGIPAYDEKDPSKSWDYTEILQELVEKYRDQPPRHQIVGWPDNYSTTAIVWYTGPSTSAEVAFVSEPGRGDIARSPIVDKYSAENVLMEGRNSWPTHKKGWRYSIPFWKPWKGAGDIRPKAPPQYVQLRDLETVEWVLLKEQNMEYVPYRERVLDLIRGGEPPAEVKGSSGVSNYIPPIYIDKLLYENGIYISPDLYLDVWDAWDTLMAAGIVVILGIWTTWGWSRHWGKKKQTR